MSFTSEQGDHYEIAHELLSRRLGTLTAEITRAEEAVDPDSKLIAQLREDRLSLGKERDDLRPENVKAVDSVLIRYRFTRAQVARSAAG